MDNNTEKKFESFSEFYPFYLSEHGDRLNRRLHFTGLFAALVILAIAIIFQKWVLLILLPFFGYGLSWIGHFFFERNKPATFKYPLYSIMGDIVMFKDILLGKIKL